MEDEAFTFGEVRLRYLRTVSEDVQNLRTVSEDVQNLLLPLNWKGREGRELS